MGKFFYFFIFMTLSVIEKTFETEVINSEIPVLIDFWAPWCGPCRMLGPVIDDIAGERQDFKCVKINVDENTDLAAQFRVQSIPFLVVMKSGKPVAAKAGASSKEDLLHWINQHI